MNLLDLRSKLEKGKELQGEVVYIKEDNLISGIDSVYKNQEDKSVVLLKSKEETIKVDHLLEILNEIYAFVGDVEVFTSDRELSRDISKKIQSVEFAQYELVKMLFINV
ncbi:hypothetical protein [Romboutsia sp. Marseille-P6047]|uniref:hypothetical protein n=1 Tax=Romboutsia sp. Marseille-P6047 TaxID=2161817 RepID=UPI000F067DF8|nr:hypothetical protein [Romboutsia sp. Marseille-P6047]